MRCGRASTPGRLHLGENPNPLPRGAVAKSSAAEVCKTSIPGSNPGGASKIRFDSERRLPAGALAKAGCRPPDRASAGKPRRELSARRLARHSFHSEEIGNTFGPNGFSMGSSRHVASSK